MIAEWLQKKPEGSYSFPVDRFKEAAARNTAILEYLGGKVLESYLPEDIFQMELQRVGNENIPQVIRNEHLPSSPTTKRGEFGEILTHLILVDVYGYLVPIYKLHGKEHKDMPMRTTDVIAFKIHDKERARDRLFLCEVKVRTSADNDVAEEAYNKLSSEVTTRISLGLTYIAKRLLQENNLGLLAEINRFRDEYSNSEYEKHPELYLVFDTAIWRDSVIARLDGHVDLPRFKCRAVLVKKLRELVNQVYENGAQSDVYL